MMSFWLKGKQLHSVRYCSDCFYPKRSPVLLSTLGNLALVSLVSVPDISIISGDPNLSLIVWLRMWVIFPYFIVLLAILILLSFVVFGIAWLTAGAWWFHLFAWISVQLYTFICFLIAYTLTVPLHFIVSLTVYTLQVQFND